MTWRMQTMQMSNQPAACCSRIEAERLLTGDGLLSELIWHFCHQSWCICCGFAPWRSQ